MKRKHSFIVTIQAEDDVKAMAVAHNIRLLLTGHKIWQGEPAGRSGVRIKKVTVSNVGEK